MSRKLIASIALAAAALAVTTRTAQAQGKAVELTAGVLGFESISCSGCSSLTTITTGGAYVAAGFYSNPGLAFEPSLATSYASSSGSSVTTVRLGLGVPIYFAKDWGRSGWYLTPAVSWQSYSCTGCQSENQFAAGAALGVKVPLNANGALRIQASYEYGFSNSDVESSSMVGIALGLSVFVK